MCYIVCLFKEDDRYNIVAIFTLRTLNKLRRKLKACLIFAASR
jgi:hypothetical protein